MRAADFFPTSAALDAAEADRAALAMLDAQRADIEQRLAALAAAKAAGLVPETDRDQCRCGNACPACGNCTALSVGCGWHRCDSNGFVDPAGSHDAQIAAQAVADHRARAAGRDR